MIDPDKAVRELMKDVGKILRPMGFRGSVNKWAMTTEHGTAHLGRTNRNNWTKQRGHTPDVRGFFMGIEAVPAPWWTYQNWCRKQAGDPSLPIDHPDMFGPGLRDLHDLPEEPVSATRLWTIRTKTDDDGKRLGWDEDIEFIREHLPHAVETLAHRVLELIEPGRYLKELLNNPDKAIGSWEPIVVMLAEYGPSSALDDAIESLRSSYAERGAESHAEEIVTYAHSR